MLKSQEFPFDLTTKCDVWCTSDNQSRVPLYMYSGVTPSANAVQMFYIRCQSSKFASLIDCTCKRRRAIVEITTKSEDAFTSHSDTKHFEPDELFDLMQ